MTLASALANVSAYASGSASKLTALLANSASTVDKLAVNNE